MEKNEKKTFLDRISKVNELRRAFWNEYRKVRNAFLGKYQGEEYEDDPDWQEIFHLLIDLYQPLIAEEMRRDTGLIPHRIPLSLSSNPTSEKDLFNRFATALESHFENLKPHDERARSGIFRANKLCLVCGLPLSGRQRNYCQEKCRSIAKSRRWRKENSDQKQLENLKYLDSIKPDLKKGVRQNRKRKHR
ncbi:MAG: hypothetical protein GX422_04585 [Deltaproteobacteria bacterium]|nr:hypothetical protein [Deltaproteobacteria bacterium]